MFALTATSHSRQRSGLGSLAFFRLALAARRQRKALAKLDSAALDDIGVTGRDACEESSRPLWDVPASWRR